MNEPLFSLKNRWFTIAVAAVAAIAAIAAAIGFLWVPRVHARDAMASLWESICSAAGAPAPYRNPGLPDDKAIYRRA